MKQISTDSILEKISLPVLVVEAVRNKDTVITDFRFVYENDAFLEQTNNFACHNEFFSILKDIIHNSDQLFQYCIKTLDDGEVRESEYLSLRMHIWFKMLIHRMDEDHCIITMQNNSSDKLKAKYIDFLENKDPVTGLNNVNNLIKSVPSIMCRNKDENKIAFITMDIDNFSLLNQFVGRETADIALQHFSEILLKTDDSEINCFRLYGDEFYIIKTNVTSADEIKTFCTDLSKRLGKAGFSASMGISVYPDDSDSIDSLMSFSDTALHVAKQKNKGGFVFYEKDFSREIENFVEIRREFKDQIENGGYKIIFQPQYYLESSKLRGYASRLSLNQKDYFDPDENVKNLVQKANLLPFLEDWYVENSIRQLAMWKNNYNEAFLMCIRFSFRQINDVQYINSVCKKLSELGISPSSIDIGLSENIFTYDINLIMTRINALRELGFKVSLVDFGIQFTSIRYLKEIQFYSIKLDRSFVDKIEAGSEIDIQILCTVIEDIRKTGVEIMAEGKIKSIRHSLLIDIDCSCIQEISTGEEPHFSLDK